MAVDSTGRRTRIYKLSIDLEIPDNPCQRNIGRPGPFTSCGRVDFSGGR